MSFALLHGGRPAHPGQPTGVGRAWSGAALAGLSGASLVLAHNLDAERAAWMMLGLCALMTSAAGYRWRQHGRLTHRDDARSRPELHD